MNKCQQISSLCAILLTLSGTASEHQRTEYGRKSEMHAAKILFVDSSTNIEFRENALRVLQRELPEVAVSDRLDSTVDLILQFDIDSQGDRKGTAELLVLSRPTAPNAVRILASYKDSKTSIWTSKLSTVLVRRFIRDFLENNPRSPARQK